MKGLITIALMCITMHVKAQIDSLQYIINKYKVEGLSVSYVSVFDISGKSQSEIKSSVIKSISAAPNLSLTQASISNDQIAGSISDLNIDFRKYGFSPMSMPIWVQSPSNAKFVIQFKDGRYRVIIKDISTKTNRDVMPLSDFAKADGTLSGVNRPIMRKSYYVFGKTLDDLFTIKEVKNDW